MIWVKLFNKGWIILLVIEINKFCSKVLECFIVLGVFAVKDILLIIKGILNNK